MDWIKIIKNIPSGRFFRLTYMTELKVKPEYKDISIFKIVNTTTRTGIQYNHIKGVLPKYPDQYTPKKPTAWEWVIKNKIKYNANTKKNYLVIAPIQKGQNSKISYMIIQQGNIVCVNDKKAINDYIIEKPISSSGGKVINIELSHILQIH